MPAFTKNDNLPHNSGNSRCGTRVFSSSKTDIAGENGVDAKEYDTDLNYTGAITFCNEENNSTYWCYFMDIREVNKKAVKIDLTDWIGV